MRSGFGGWWRGGDTSIAVLAVCLAVIGAPPHPVVGADPQPLPRAHAHNDYHHPRPLQDALAHGFCSVEADVFQVDGQLLVGHDRTELRPERTLQRLYLDPLQRRVANHGGRVYANGPSFTLLIDFKSDAQPTYAALTQLLSGYESMLAHTRDGTHHDGPVQIVISGNRPIATVSAEHRTGNCRVAIDGRLADLSDTDERAWMPLISDRWSAHFSWDGRGEIPPQEWERLQAVVAETHAQGRRLRFWATADRPEMWQALARAGVDLINTDDLAGLATFLRADGDVNRRSSGAPKR